MGVGGEERGHDVRADIGGNAGQQERGGLRGDAQIGGGQAHGFERGGDERGLADVVRPGSPQSRCIMVVLPVRDRKSTSPIPACSSSPASIAETCLAMACCSGFGPLQVFFPFRFVAVRLMTSAP